MLIYWGRGPQPRVLGQPANVLFFGPLPQGSAGGGVVAVTVQQTGSGDRTRKKKRGKVGGKTVWFDTPDELAALRQAYRETTESRRAAAKRGTGAVIAEPSAPMLGTPASGLGLLGDVIRAAYQSRGVEVPEIDHEAQRRMVRKRQDEEALMLLLSD